MPGYFPPPYVGVAGVTSINGQVGTAVLASADVGAGPALAARVPVVATAANANANQFVPIDLSPGNDCTMTLPNAPGDGTQIVIKIVKQSSPAHTSRLRRVQVNAAGADVFNITGGAVVDYITALGQAKTYKYYAASKIWLISEGVSLANTFMAPPGVGVAATDTANLQAALDALPSGGQLVLPAGAQYLINATLQMGSNSSIVGLAGGPNLSSAVIKADVASNLDAVIAGSAWYASSGINNYQSIINVSIDPNGANQTAGLGHGIALTCFRAAVIGCRIVSAGFGTGNGIQFGSIWRNGSATGTVTNEVRILNNIVDLGDAGGHCIYGSGATATDSWVCDNTLSHPGLTGVTLDAAAGSVVRGNHVYSFHTYGIDLNNCSNTRCDENMIETHAAVAANFGNVYQIRMSVGHGSTCNGNTLWAPSATVTGNTFYGIYIKTAFSGAKPGITLVGNAFTNQTAAGSPTVIPIFLDNTTIASTAFKVSETGNNTDSNGAFFPSGLSGTIIFDQGQYSPEHYGSGVPTIAGNAGDRYWRTDTPATAGQRLYICTVAGVAGSATWVATAV